MAPSCSSDGSEPGQVAHRDEARYSCLCCSRLCLTAIALAVSVALAGRRETRAWGKEAAAQGMHLLF